ncbi:hypothetical protein [Oceanirhabdus sp. W0125-5]|uniref:hypothetical protein n=1 Tax=Oceanirhabdus sp. W0125-5 TaxID=2999116 RepID=UPI0022F33D21|nr:hypothetical protein [Oceanirhabdus sp. W0125-5]WBW94970.1 hypothetical protein OW730_14845 [Oceanirhabdus sp. W0125-5]
MIDEYIKKIKGENTLVVLVVVYGNREYDDSLIEMKDIFSSNGFIPIAGGSFIGEHSYTKEVGTKRPD